MARLYLHDGEPIERWRKQRQVHHQLPCDTFKMDETDSQEWIDPSWRSRCHIGEELFCSHAHGHGSSSHSSGRELAVERRKERQCQPALLSGSKRFPLPYSFWEPLSVSHSIVSPAAGRRKKRPLDRDCRRTLLTWLLMKRLIGQEKDASFILQMLLCQESDPGRRKWRRMDSCSWRAVFCLPSNGLANDWILLTRRRDGLSARWRLCQTPL